MRNNYSSLTNQLQHGNTARDHELEMMHEQIFIWEKNLHNHQFSLEWKIKEITEEIWRSACIFLIATTTLNSLIQKAMDIEFVTGNNAN